MRCACVCCALVETIPVLRWWQLDSRPVLQLLFCFLSVVLEGETSKHDAHINMHKAQLNKNEERFKLLECACYSGKLIWKVTDYKVKKREAMEGHVVSVFSQPFYTSRCG